MAQEPSSWRIRIARCPSCGVTVPLKRLFLSSPLQSFSCISCGKQLRLNVERNRRWARATLAVGFVAIFSAWFRHSAALWALVIGLAALAAYPFVAIVEGENE